MLSEQKTTAPNKPQNFSIIYNYTNKAMSSAFKLSFHLVVNVVNI